MIMTDKKTAEYIAALHLALDAMRNERDTLRRRVEDLESQLGLQFVNTWDELKDYYPEDRSS